VEETDSVTSDETLSIREFAMTAMRREAVIAASER